MLLKVVIEDIFYDWMPPEVYAEKVKNEYIFGKPDNQFDAEGGLIEIHSVTDYMFFMYPDYHSEEYEVHIIETIADALNEYDLRYDKLVVLKTEG